MCITINEATLSKTKILSLPLENGNHFIAYQNSVVNNSSEEYNAMVLPILGTTKKEWFHNTSEYSDFLNQMSKRDLNKTLGIVSRGISKSLERFEIGMYNIGLTTDLTEAKEFLSEFSISMKDDLYNFFNDKYPNCSFAVCVFSNKKQMEAQPIAFEYTPNNPNLLYFPTVDCHTGDAPDLTKNVDTDHTIIFEHIGEYNSIKFPIIPFHMDTLPEFLNDRKIRAEKLETPLQNGDTFINLNILKQTDFSDCPHYYRK